MGKWVDIRLTMGLLLMLTAVLVVVLRGPGSSPSEEHDWLEAMRRAVVAEQANEGPFWGSFAPYIQQVEVVRRHLKQGETSAVYESMNRLMGMLEQRENGIPVEAADRLFDYCYTVTPAKYHDVTRHLDRYIGHRFGESVEKL